MAPTVADEALACSPLLKTLKNHQFPSAVKASTPNRYDATPAKDSSIPSKQSPPVDLSLSAKLETALRKLRTVLVKEGEEWFKPFHVFSNAALQDISKRIPRTKRELLEINGIGDRKLIKYGDRILDTIEAVLNKNSSNSPLQLQTPAQTQPEVNPVLNKNGSKSPLQLQTPAQTQPEVNSNLSAKLDSALRMLRSTLVKESGGAVLPYHIFTNATLQDISDRIPRTEKELLKINGIGDAKISKYGDRILDTIEAALKECEQIDKNSCNSPLQAQTPPQPQPEINSDLSAKLDSALRKLRSTITKEAGGEVRPYHILTNATLQDISKRMPRTEKELLKINGISKAKISKYGDQILERIEATVNEHNQIDTNSINSPLQVQAPTQPQPQVNLELSSKLDSALRMLRRVLLKEAGEGFKKFHIFTNATLQHFCERTPRTKQELLKIHGISEAQISKYGDRILETIEKTIEEFNNNEKTTYNAKRKRVSMEVSNGVPRDDDDDDEDDIPLGARIKKRV